MSRRTVRTVGEWDAQPGFHMNWCILDKESEQELNEYEDRVCPLARSEDRNLSDEEKRRWQELYDAQKLDLRAGDVPDGIHPVYHVAGPLPEETGRSSGLVVRNGEFEPFSTQAAVFEAVCKAYGTTADAVRTGKDGIDDVYIERMEWDPEQQAVRVHTGS